MTGTLRERIQAAARCDVEACGRPADWNTNPEMRVARCREHTEALFTPEWRRHLKAKDMTGTVKFA